MGGQWEGFTMMISMKTKKLSLFSEVNENFSIMNFYVSVYNCDYFLGVMRWLTVCVMMLVWVTVTAAPAELRCVDPCLDGGAHKFPTLGFSRTFMREGKKYSVVSTSWISLNGKIGLSSKMTNYY